MNLDVMQMQLFMIYSLVISPYDMANTQRLKFLNRVLEILGYDVKED